ncbi:response regulator [Bacteroidales bacterium AH-315-I05]|nr:response regulator [Bacteroidales bacterium AH-315-I05]
MNYKEKIKIFIVEDDTFFNKMIENHLKTINKSGGFQDYFFSTNSYSTGEECLKNLSKNPDIIILDYYLDSENKSAQNGFRTLQQIKKKNKNVIVIILSSQQEMVMTVELLKAGAYDYVMKDDSCFFRIGALVQKILNEKQLRRKKQNNILVKVAAMVLLLILLTALIV